MCVILCVPDLQAAERPPIYQPISLRWNSPAPGAGGQGFTVTIITVSTHILSLQEPAPALLSVSLITTFLPIYNGGGTTQQNKPEKLLQASNFNLLTSTSWNLQWISQTLFRPKIPKSSRKKSSKLYHQQTKNFRIVYFTLSSGYNDNGLMSGCILMAHFLMTKIATARAKQEQRSQDLARSTLRVVEEWIFSLLFCSFVEFLCESKIEMSAVLIHSLSKVYFYPSLVTSEQKAPVWSGVDITPLRRMSVTLYQSWSKCPLYQQAPAVSGGS